MSLTQADSACQACWHSRLLCGLACRRADLPWPFSVCSDLGPSMKQSLLAPGSRGNTQNRCVGLLVLPETCVGGTQCLGSPGHLGLVKHADPWALDQPTCVRTSHGGALGVCIFQKCASQIHSQVGREEGSQEEELAACGSSLLRRPSVGL